MTTTLHALVKLLGIALFLGACSRTPSPSTSDTTGTPETKLSSQSDTHRKSLVGVWRDEHRSVTLTFFDDGSFKREDQLSNAYYVDRGQFELKGNRLQISTLESSAPYFKKNQVTVDIHILADKLTLGDKSESLELFRIGN